VFFFPDAVSRLAWGQASELYNIATAWAETNSNVLVIETEPDLAPVAAMTAADDLVASSRTAVYYPHVYIQDPLGKSSAAVRKVGPSGAVAGLYIATDTKYGPFKTPAGVDARIQDAIALERAFTPKELDQLNDGVSADGTVLTNVNVVRNLPGAGIVVMGGRTTLQDGTANRYINMRRSLIYIEKRLRDLLQFAVFENNTEILWARINTVLGAFLNEYRNQGGLRGTTPAASFFVKCDEENNTNASIAAGEVHVEVGVALEYPTEFVVINLSQKTAE
jgi:phage tail sheath protein FI